MAKIRWQKSEIDYVMENYLKFETADIAAHLNRSAKAVHHVACKLKLARLNTWSENDIAYLKDNARKITYEEIASHLGRSLGSCYNMAYKLKLTKPEDRSYLNLQRTIKVTESDVEYILSNYMKKTDHEIAEYLGITYSKVASIRKMNNITKIGGKTLGKMTNPERIMSSILTSFNILFDFEPIIFKQRPDFYLPNHRIIIEVNGDYWHGNPCIYTEFNDIQLRHMARDIDKMKVYKELGFLTLIVWEQDIVKNKDVVKDKILEYINSAVFSSNAIDNDWAKSVNSFEWFQENTEENQETKMS